MGVLFCVPDVSGGCHGLHGGMCVCVFGEVTGHVLRSGPAPGVGWSGPVCEAKGPLGPCVGASKAPGGVPGRLWHPDLARCLRGALTEEQPLLVGALLAHGSFWGERTRGPEVWVHVVAADTPDRPGMGWGGCAQASLHEGRWLLAWVSVSPLVSPPLPGYPIGGDRQGRACRP